MEKKIEQGRLYDFYGELLKPHQKRILEAAVYDDLSLAEIAAEEGISRQGVHDLIRRVTDNLQEYEDRLHMITRYDRITAHAMRLKEMAMEQNGISEQAASTLYSIADDILRDLV